MTKPITKAELRTIYLEKRKALAAEEVTGFSRNIARRFFDGFDLSNVRCLQGFIPIRKFNEIDTSLIFETIWRDLPQVRILAPRININRGGMDNIVLTPESVLNENRWGIAEPVDGEVVDPLEIDMVLVPLLCADASGHRVGYGKGFYDRFLARCSPRCQKIGLGNYAPDVMIDDIDAHDIRLNAYVTPDETYSFA